MGVIDDEFGRSNLEIALAMTPGLGVIIGIKKVGSKIIDFASPLAQGMARLGMGEDFNATGRVVAFGIVSTIWVLFQGFAGGTSHLTIPFYFASNALVIGQRAYSGYLFHRKGQHTAFMGQAIPALLFPKLQCFHYFRFLEPLILLLIAFVAGKIDGGIGFFLLASTIGHYRRTSLAYKYDLRLRQAAVNAGLAQPESSPVTVSTVEIARRAA